MNKLKISFNPIFIIFAFLVIYFSWVQQFFVYLVILLLHELAHYVVAKMYGYKLNKIIFMPYGAGLKGESNIFKPAHEIVIALAGPIFNIILALIGVAFWWYVPLSYFYTELFVKINIVIGVFNLLPIFPLDGGRIVVAYFSKSNSKIKLYKIMKIIGVVFSVLFAIAFIISVFINGINLNWFFMSIFLFMSSIINDYDVYYERTYISNLKNKNLTSPIEVKRLVVSNKTEYVKLVKYIKGNYFIEFLLMDDKNNIVGKINEVQVINKLLNSNYL